MNSPSIFAGLPNHLIRDIIKQRYSDEIKDYWNRDIPEEHRIKNRDIMYFIQGIVLLCSAENTTILPSLARRTSTLVTSIMGPALAMAREKPRYQALCDEARSLTVDGRYTPPSLEKTWYLRLRANIEVWRLGILGAE